MATPVLESLIEIDETGRARIAGERMRVSELMAWKLGCNWSAEELMDEFPWYTPAQIYAALSYFHAHEDEIRAEMAADEALYEAALTVDSPLREILRRNSRS